jgi:hypothetical protein
VLEAHAAPDFTLTASYAIAGTPVALAATGERLCVAKRLAGAGALECLSSAGLAAKGNVPLRHAPTSLVRFDGGLVAGTDEGIEVFDPDVRLLARMPLGPVAALSAHGDRLEAIAVGQLVEIDLCVAYAPTRVRSTALVGTQNAVAAIPGGRACVAGLSLRCLTPSGATFVDSGEEALASPAVSLSSFGPGLLMGTERGLVVFDARGEPRSSGFYPALAGRAAMAGNEIFAATADRVSRLQLGRGTPAPLVSLGAPTSAAPGTRIDLTAAVDQGGDPLATYTAELLVDEAVVQVADGHLPAWVDLPGTGASAHLELRVRDLAGHIASATATVTLVDDGVGPTLAAVRAPTEVLGGALFKVVAVPQDPARVASVELALEGAAPLVVSPPP